MTMVVTMMTMTTMMMMTIMIMTMSMTITVPMMATMMMTITVDDAVVMQVMAVIKTKMRRSMEIFFSTHHEPRSPFATSVRRQTR